VFDKTTLQEMADVLESALGALGFSLNASNTECMVFPPLSAKPDAYALLKAAAEDAKVAPFKVAGETAVRSDNFRYLGHHHLAAPRLDARVAECASAHPERVAPHL
jgi:hypothetical protein